MPSYRDQQQLDKGYCPEAAALCSRALYFMPYQASVIQQKVARPANGALRPGCGSQRLLRCRSHPAGRCPNSSSLFRPLAAVVAVAPSGRGVTEGDGEGYCRTARADKMQCTAFCSGTFRRAISRLAGRSPRVGGKHHLPLIPRQTKTARPAYTGRAGKTFFRDA